MKTSELLDKIDEDDKYYGHHPGIILFLVSIPVASLLYVIVF